MKKRCRKWVNSTFIQSIRCEFLHLQLYVVFFLLASFAGNAQDISIQSIANQQGKVVINFTLEDENPDRHYTLRLYSSIDNYVQPLAEVAGNVGIDQRVGGNKQIIWDAAKELSPEFNDYISFEVRAFIYIPFIEMEDLSQYGAFKRGKNYTIKWTGGRPDNVLNFELYKGDKKIGMPFRDVANTGSYDKMMLPKGTKPGSEYRFRIADRSNSDDEMFTGYFKVKAQIPLLAKIVGGLIVGGVGYWVYDEFSNSGSEPIPDPGSPNRGN